MDIGVLIGFGACAVLLALATDLSGSTVRIVGSMFHVPELGWPSGVQEDDDLHWSWAAGTPGDPSGRQRTVEPELEEVVSGSIRLQLQHVRRGSY